MSASTIRPEDRSRLRPLWALLAAAALGCGYHRLDRQPAVAPWQVRGETVRIGAFENHTAHLGVDAVFRKSLENRIVTASPWRLVPTAAEARWVIRATLESYEVRPLAIALGSTGNSGSAGSATRQEVVVTASVTLLDGVTGDVVVARPRLTFANQYRVDQNFASFDNQELHALDTLADDFAESFVTQLLEGED